MKRFASLVCLAMIGLTSFNTSVSAANTGFIDLDPGDFGYDAALYLQKRNIMSGYDNGTFRPDNLVTRSEAMKIIAFPLISTKDEANNSASSGFSDVEKNAWYLPYVNWAAKKGIIDAPSKSPQFRPAKSVTKAEFLKMMMLAYGVETTTFGEITLPLASDVTDAKQWYYPYMRYAVSTAVTTIPKSGLLAPARPLTRADVAVLLHRFLQYKDGERMQTILDTASNDIFATQEALDKQDLKSAQYASARALLLARGAHARMPNEKATKVEVKLAEAMRALVRAYEAGVKDDLDGVVKHSNDAWYLADQAVKIAGSNVESAVGIKTYAQSFANTARDRLKK